MSAAVDLVIQVLRFRHDLRNAQDGNVTYPCILRLDALVELFVSCSLVLKDVTFVDSANVVGKANSSKQNDLKEERGLQVKWEPLFNEGISAINRAA